MQEYADPVIDWLDAGRGILEHRFFRDVSGSSSEIPSGVLRKPQSVLYTAPKRIIHEGSIDNRG
jgi:CTD nuclear envelope phosphatase 1